MKDIEKNKSRKKFLLILILIINLVGILLVFIIFFNKKEDCSSYSIGDTGPAEGIIFYKEDGICYEAPIFDQPDSEWGCYKTSILGADGTKIGTGKQNTKDILVSCTERPIAASVCDNLILGGKFDWFLPSENLLNQMYNQKSTIGDFSSNYYWSSSESSSHSAWVQGSQNHGLKDYSNRIRCTRSF